MHGTPVMRRRGAGACIRCGNFISVMSGCTGKAIENSRGTNSGLLVRFTEGMTKRLSPMRMISKIKSGMKVKASTKPLPSCTKTSCRSCAGSYCSDGMQAMEFSQGVFLVREHPRANSESVARPNDFHFQCSGRRNRFVGGAHLETVIRR
jgi:hypothetical protein